MGEVIEGLMGSIRETPLDDAPRMVLADYYDVSHQPERAALVRLQLAHAKLLPYEAETVRNRIQQRPLLHAHAKAWRNELPQFKGVAWGRFERGLVSRVGFDSVEALATHGAACHRAMPFSTVVVRWPRLMKDPVALEAIDGLREVTVVGQLLKQKDMRWLANSPLLSTIRALNLVDSQMTLAAFRELLASPYLAQLEALRLPVHNFGNDGVALLVEAALPNLVDLDVSVASADDLGSGGRNEETMDATGAALLAGWLGLSRLHTLDLTGNQIGAEGLLAVLSSPHAAGLKTLRIRGLADWDEDGEGPRTELLEALGSTAAGMALDELDISETGLNEASGAALAACAALAELKVLTYNYTQSGLQYVAQAPWSTSLRVLSANDGGEEAMRVVLNRALPRLHTLSLGSQYGWSQVGTSVGQVFKDAPAQPALLELDLTDCGIDDEGLDVLGTVTSLPALRALRIGSIHAEDGEVGFEADAAARLVASPLGRQLESLDCGHLAHLRAPEPAPTAMVGRGGNGSLRLL